MWHNGQSDDDRSESIDSSNQAHSKPSEKIDTSNVDEEPAQTAVKLLQGSSDKDSDHVKVTGEQSTRLRSASRDSSVVGDPKSYLDSISATSAHQNWSYGREDDPSMSSIKGDSVSATIADYNRKHRTQNSEDNSKASVRGPGTGEELLPKSHDDVSSNINFYPAGGSTSGTGASNLKIVDSVGVISQHTNIDAFDIIEESSNLSSCDETTRAISNHNCPRPSRHRRHRSKHHRTSSSDQAQSIDELAQEIAVHQIEPIILRGNGNLTLFGLSNSFSSEFPAALIGRVSREEFNRTMKGVNTLLRDQQSLSAKLLLFGSLCCCCSFGLSLVWPSIALKKRSKMNLEKFLSSENNRLYTKLGLNWKLAEQRCYSNHAFVEYVLMIEFTPKINLYLPD